MPAQQSGALYSQNKSKVQSGIGYTCSLVVGFRIVLKLTDVKLTQQVAFGLVHREISDYEAWEWTLVDCQRVIGCFDVRGSIIQFFAVEEHFNH